MERILYHIPLRKQRGHRSFLYYLCSSSSPADDADAHNADWATWLTICSDKTQ